MAMDAQQPIELFAPERRERPPERPQIRALTRFERDQAEEVEPAGASRSDAPYALSVRSVRPTDLPALLRPPEFVLLNEPRIAARSYAPFRAAVAALAPGRDRPKFFVARSNGNL